MEDGQVEFLTFDETPAEKYLGVASIRFFGQIILRYKVQRTKDGNGIFIAAPSFKKVDESGEHWCQWFMLDSMSQNETVANLIKTKVKAHFTSKSSDSSNSGSGGASYDQNALGGYNQPRAQKTAPASSGWGSQAFAHRTA
jgi:hypothetical protein